MDFQIETEELHLAGKISINDVELLMEILTQYIQTQKEIIKINLAEVETMDIMVLQVLIVAKRITKQTDKLFELWGVAGELREIFELSGMDSVFKIYQSQSSSVDNR